MNKYLVADSYKNMEQVGEPFENEKGKKVIKVKGECPRCSGRGFIVARVHNGQMIPVKPDGGTCYKCDGKKYITKEVRVYTEKEYATMQKSKERAAKKKAEAIAAKEKELIDNAAAYKHEVALKLGFGEDEKAYLVYGDDTFVIKEELKRLGARFDPTLKWYFSSKVELPEGYFLCEMSFDELYDYNPKIKWATFKEDAKEIVRLRLAELQGPPTSIYYPGEEKERIRHITAKVSKVHGFAGMYGYCYVYTFKSGDYVFTWITSKSDANLAAGDLVDLTGTIKKFEEYLGEKITYLTRCIVKKIGE